MEVFKEIELNGMNYQVSDYGRIIGARGELKQRIDKDGYSIVTVGSYDNRTGVRVHRIVALAFVPRTDEQTEVNHKDFNRGNNMADNLEWCTHTENVRHSSDNGRYEGHTKGVKNGRSKYTEEEVENIRIMFDGGMSVMDIIKELFPDLDYQCRKNKWSRINEIAKRKTYI